MLQIFENTSTYPMSQTRIHIFRQQLIYLIKDSISQIFSDRIPKACWEMLWCRELNVTEVRSSWICTAPGFDRRACCDVSPIEDHIDRGSLNHGRSKINMIIVIVGCEGNEYGYSRKHETKRMFKNGDILVGASGSSSTSIGRVNQPCRDDALARMQPQSLGLSFLSTPTHICMKWQDIYDDKSPLHDFSPSITVNMSEPVSQAALPQIGRPLSLIPVGLKVLPPLEPTDTHGEAQAAKRNIKADTNVGSSSRFSVLPGYRCTLLGPGW